eukprot:TRINITY_DN2768_c0_g1_i3.p2 TRINITY_DN2768_c0_g1~~TRINITY_DN2768_c0_g1_i3.p2  ORF type:complete len:509 (+),score=174.01 TRINITY_DN2768_c0_g1_i3:230-1528(+)
MARLREENRSRPTSPVADEANASVFSPGGGPGSPFSPCSPQRTPSPAPMLRMRSGLCSPTHGAQGGDSRPLSPDNVSEVLSDSAFSSGSRARSANRTTPGRRTRSLQRGGNPGDRTNVRTSSRHGTRHARAALFDLEMPHRCGLKAVAMVDCSLLFAAVTDGDGTRSAALPLLRTLRREFLRSFRPGELARLSVRDCQRRFGRTMSELLQEANRDPGEPVRQDHHLEIPAQPRALSALYPRQPVFLNVYNIVEADVNASFQMLGVGIHHSGVEVYGREWSFGGALPGSPKHAAGETGVFNILPRTALPASHFKEQVLVGHTTKTPEEVDYVLSTFTSDPGWNVGAYHLLERNCNDFCAELIRRLGGWEFPSWINRAAKVSQAVLPDPVIRGIVDKMQQGPPQQQRQVPQRKHAPRRRFADPTPAAAGGPAPH